MNTSRCECRRGSSGQAGNGLCEWYYESDIVNELLADEREGRTLTSEERQRIDNALYKTVVDIWYQAAMTYAKHALNDELFGNAIDEVVERSKRSRLLEAKKRAAVELDNKLNKLREAPPPLRLRMMST